MKRILKGLQNVFTRPFSRPMKKNCSSSLLQDRKKLLTRPPPEQNRRIVLPKLFSGIVAGWAGPRAGTRLF
jgi:hypothetical protein